MLDLEETNSGYVSYYAITLFGGVRAGVREGECLRLTQSLLAGEKVLQPGGIIIRRKNGVERMRPWNPAMRAWLKAYPPNPGIFPASANARDDTITAIRKKHRLPRNVVRHTAITVLSLSSDS
jgi:hypothetical protein